MNNIICNLRKFFTEKCVSIDKTFITPLHI
jgi:hypothetical protein